MNIAVNEPAGLAIPRQPAEESEAPANVAAAVEKFLLREARLLDAERYEEWLGMLAPDIHYWMPGVQSVYRKGTTPAYDPDRMAYFDDDLLLLRRRVTRFLHNTAWAEDPPTRHCHIISGIETLLTGNPDEYLVHSVFVNCRGRNETEQDVLHGRRRDILRRYPENTFRLARREIYIPQAVLLAKNLNTFL